MTAFPQITAMTAGALVILQMVLQFATSIKEGLPRMTVQNIGSGIHFGQEDQLTSIGNAIAGWVAGLKQ